MVFGKGSADRHLTVGEIRQIVSQGLGTLSLAGKRVLVIIPDGTRSMPMPLMFESLREALAPHVSALDFLVALGTHQPMSDAKLSELVGDSVVGGKVGRSHIFNHEWSNPECFAHIGDIPADEINHISNGLLSQDVPVRLNRLVTEYDHVILCGPVFPHEVVGFSGGNKYLFPGIAGPEIIDFMHWLGALITNYEINGAGYTPVRAVIDRAAAFVDCPTHCFALVVTNTDVSGIFFGSPQAAWQAAAALSAQKHITYVSKPFRQVLSVVPKMYEDLWTAAKGVYKMEPAMAEGGEVILYAPHITEVSYTHGKLIDEIGYHCRDYFLAQWDRFQDYPWGVLAHSTHVRGLGTYDPATGTETSRIRVTLATGIPEERCRRVNLGYLDPATVNPRDWEDRRGEGRMVEPRAGEILYRIKE